MTTNEKAKQVERAVISDALKGKLNGMKDQANVALQGIACVTKSDIVNLILADHADALSLAEIDKLKASHLDQVKYAFWIAKRLKEAQAAGEQLTLQDLLATSQPVMMENPVKARRPRKKKDSSDQAADATPESAS
jgi:hypothetical protein